MTTPAPQPTHPPSPTPPPTHLPARRVLTMDDLPSEFEDEEALPSEFHLLFAMLLRETFLPTTVPPEQSFCAIDLYLHFIHEGVARGLRPDWMGVVGVPALYRGERTRASYVVEDEGRAPLIIVEALSPKTRRNDLAEFGRGAWSEDQKPLRKWDIYESVLKVPYYVTIDDRREAIRWFRHDGLRYVEEHPADERLWVGEAGLSVGAWRGAYERRTGLWLRFYDGEGALIPTKAEREALEREAKERERRAKERERRAKERERKAKERERAAKEAALQAAERERQAKEQERAAKEAALQELERLKAKLRDLNRAE